MKKTVFVLMICICISYVCINNYSNIAYAESEIVSAQNSERMELDDEVKLSVQLIIRGIIGGLISAVFIICGIALLISKPSINNFFGYKSKLSMKSEENWIYANKVISICLIVSGIILMLVRSCWLAFLYFSRVGGTPFLLLDSLLNYLTSILQAFNLILSSLLLTFYKNNFYIFSFYLTL